MCRAPSIGSGWRRCFAWCRSRASIAAGRVSSPADSSSGLRWPARSSTGHRPGETVRVAVRPERVQIEAAGGPLLECGSRLEGTIAEIVFLGMYTQFHVDTRAGALVSHRLADESLAPFEPGARVTLSWEPEQASLLGEPS